MFIFPRDNLHQQIIISFIYLDTLENVNNSFNSENIMNIWSISRSTFFFILVFLILKIFTNEYNWRSPSLSELTSMIFSMELIHFGSKAFKWIFIKFCKEISKFIDFLNFKLSSRTSFIHCTEFESLLHKNKYTNQSKY